jgi:hypothetical protein
MGRFLRIPAFQQKSPAAKGGGMTAGRCRSNGKQLLVHLNVFYHSVRLCVHSSNKTRTTKKISAISFAPVNPLRKRCWPRVSRKRETGKAQDMPHARSLCSLETQKTQSKKQQKVGMIGLSLRPLRLCVRQHLLLSQSCPNSSVSTNDVINQFEPNFSNVDSQKKS